MIVAGLYETLYISTSTAVQFPVNTIKQLTTENLKSEGMDLNTVFDQLIKPNQPILQIKKTGASFEKVRSKLDKFRSSVMRTMRTLDTSDNLRIFSVNPQQMAKFRFLSFILIVINSGVLCADNSNLNESTQISIIRMDFVLLMTFYLEIIIKILIQRDFFQTFLNVLDFLLFVLNASVQIYLKINNCNYLNNSCQSTLYAIVRSLQVLRIFRILVSSYWKSISVLILEFLKILRKMSDLWVTAIIVFTVFSLIGRDLFAFSKAPHGIEEEELHRLNFDGFFNSFFSNFLIFIAEEWHILMMIHLRTFNNTQVIVFFTVNLLICTVFFNKIFLATLINNLVESKNIKRMIEGKFNRFKKLKWVFTQFFMRFSFLSSLIEKIKKEKQTRIERLSLKKSMKQSQDKKNVTRRENIKEKIRKFKSHRYFVAFMFLSVICSLVILAMHDPYQSKYSKFNRTLTYIDVVIFITFAFELFIELIVHERGWLSAKIVMQTFISLIYLIYFTYELDSIKILLIFRLFLLIDFSKELKLTFKALLRSLLDILQLFFFFLLITVVFAIIGVKCFKGAFWYCNGLETEYLEAIQSKTDCFDMGGDWLNHDFNFDNIFTAVEYMFVVANSEGWIPLM